MQPLFLALVGKPKTLQWNEKMISAFNLTKEALARTTMLAHPHADAPTSITVDASGVAVGAALEQLVNGSWQPLAFFSRQLRTPEQKYNTFDCELLSLYLAVRHFRYFLEGRVFTAFTDPTAHIRFHQDIFGQLGSSASSLQYRNTPQISDTLQERATS